MKNEFRDVHFIFIPEMDVGNIWIINFRQLHIHFHCYSKECLREHVCVPNVFSLNIVILWKVVILMNQPKMEFVDDSSYKHRPLGFMDTILLKQKHVFDFPFLFVNHSINIDIHVCMHFTPYEYIHAHLISMSIFKRQSRQISRLSRS